MVTEYCVSYHSLCDNEIDSDAGVALVRTLQGCRMLEVLKYEWCTLKYISMARELLGFLVIQYNFGYFTQFNLDLYKNT